MLGAIKAAGPGGADAGQRKILVLSDGKDTTNTNLTDVLDTIKQSGAGVDVVSLQKGTDANQPLDAMASAGKGKVFTTADPAALTHRVRQRGRRPGSPDRGDGPGAGRVRPDQLERRGEVPAGSQTFTASAYVPVRSAADIETEKAAAAKPQPVKAGPLAISRERRARRRRCHRCRSLGFVGVLALGGGKPAQNLTLTEQIQAYGVMAVPGQAGPRTRRCTGRRPSADRPGRRPRRRSRTTRTSRRGSPPPWRRRASTCDLPSGCCSGPGRVSSAASSGS